MDFHKRARKQKTAARRILRPTAFVEQILQSNHVHSAQLAAVLGIGLHIVGDLLALVQRTVASTLDSGEVDEHIVAALIVGDEAVALLSVEPFYSTSHVIPP